ncbi:general substrate transporter [Mycena albidolilacea]|uniref:General substrate transporter n=1 Tax=Mycena albidolilacea TaxID=1033008 RepID=A0AAD6ZW17_9AGAR|nr:general substrate transporter [Mycena albidolilacea]
MSSHHNEKTKESFEDDLKSGPDTAADGESIAEVYDPALEAAIVKSDLKGFSRRSFMLYFIVMVGFLNAVSSGFDGSLMGGINAMPQYLHYFNYESSGKATGIVFMIYVTGNCVGALFAGPATEVYGRRGGMFLGGLFILVGSVVSVTAQSREAFIGGRFVLGFGIAISTTAAPTWVTELAPPQWRGRLGAMYNSCFFIGSIPATGAMVGTQKMSSTWAWRLPLILQIVPPLIVMSCVWFLPESPRWLISRGRTEEARQILIDYHSNDGQSNAVIELEMKEFQEQIAVKREDAFWDYRVLFRTRNHRWRMVCLALMCVNGQLAGNGLITYFLPVVFENAGVTSTHTQLVYNFANSILSAFGAFSGAALTDKTGRRRRLFIGSFVLACMLATVAALSSKYGTKGNTNVAGAHASIAFIFLFGIIYAFTYTPLQALYCAEVMSQDMRAKGMAVHILISNIAGFINTFANSVGLKNLSWKYYFVFVAWDLIASVLWYFLGVETVGRTLEQLDTIFDAPWPARASTQKVAVKLNPDGTVYRLGEKRARD